jgi:heat shock protein HspQ
MPNDGVLFFPRFSKGQIVFHRSLNYRGVIFAVDLEFKGSMLWYERLPYNKPPLDRPWYHVLVDEQLHITYVAEMHLTKCPLGIPVEHPLLQNFFNKFENGRYSFSSKNRSNSGGDCLRFVR